MNYQSDLQIFAQFLHSTHPHILGEPGANNQNMTKISRAKLIQSKFTRGAKELPWDFPTPLVNFHPYQRPIPIICSWFSEDAFPINLLGKSQVRFEVITVKESLLSSAILLTTVK